MKHILGLSVSVWLCTAALLYAQDSLTIQPSRYSFQLTHILTRDGTMRTGWFLGTYGDTLVAQIAKKTERISRRDLVRVDVERPSQRGMSTIAGMLMGIYVGNGIALKADNQPFLFMRDNTEGEVALLSALFGLVGGVMGSLAGGAASNVDKFDFTGDEAANASAWRDLVESNSSARGKGTFHLSFQGGWVQGPLPNPGKSGSYYYAYDAAQATSLNMLRRIQLTYSVTNFFDAGFAYLWLGQPSVSHYSPSPGGNILLSLEGSGGYVVGVFQPLWTLGLKSVQWDIGAGVGSASYRCKADVAPYYYTTDSLARAVSREQSNTAFSTLLFTEFKVYLSDYFSLGVQADWVYNPDKVPVVPGFKFDSDLMGTTSIGFVLSFHI